jgi:hypothetical protein
MKYKPMKKPKNKSIQYSKEAVERLKRKLLMIEFDQADSDEKKKELLIEHL